VSIHGGKKGKRGDLKTGSLTEKCIRRYQKRGGGKVPSTVVRISRMGEKHKKRRNEIMTMNSKRPATTFPTASKNEEGRLLQGLLSDQKRPF